MRLSGDTRGWVLIAGLVVLAGWAGWALRGDDDALKSEVLVVEDGYLYDLGSSLVDDQCSEDEDPVGCYRLERRTRDREVIADGREFARVAAGGPGVLVVDADGHLRDAEGAIVDDHCVGERDALGCYQDRALLCDPSDFSGPCSLQP